MDLDSETMDLDNGMEEWTMKFQDLENGTQERIDMRMKVVGIAGIEAEVDLTQR